MANDEFPNRCLADSACTIYRDAMRRYIASILDEERKGDWIYEFVLDGEAERRHPKSFRKRRQSLLEGVPPKDLIDLADISFVIDKIDKRLPGCLVRPLQDNDRARMKSIRELRNDLQHPNHPGDCTESEAMEIVILCRRVLERFGLHEAVKQLKAL